MSGLEVGAAAPDFTLRNQFGEDVTLSGLVAERPTLLVFYPFAFSGICTGELCHIRDNLPRYDGDAMQVVGISCDAMFTQRAWADAEGFDFPLLSDFWPHGAIARAYGVFDDEHGLAVRGTFLVDASMTVLWSLINGPGEARDFSPALEVAENL